MVCTGKKTDYYGFLQFNTRIKPIGFSVLRIPTTRVDSYYFNPILDGELIFFGIFDQGANKVDCVEHDMSALVQLSEDGDVSSNYIDIPVVQGVGFVSYSTMEILWLN